MERKHVFTRSIQYLKDMAGEWESSSTTENTKSCNGEFDWLHPRNLGKLEEYTGHTL